MGCTHHNFILVLLIYQPVSSKRFLYSLRRNLLHYVDTSILLSGNLLHKFFRNATLCFILNSST
jgi:hypothetical protein